MLKTNCLPNCPEAETGVSTAPNVMNSENPASDIHDVVFNLSPAKDIMTEKEYEKYCSYIKQWCVSIHRATMTEMEYGNSDVWWEKEMKYADTMHDQIISIAEQNGLDNENINSDLETSLKLYSSMFEKQVVDPKATQEKRL